MQQCSMKIIQMNFKYNFIFDQNLNDGSEKASKQETGEENMICWNDSFLIWKWNYGDRVELSQAIFITNFSSFIQYFSSFEDKNQNKY